MTYDGDLPAIFDLDGTLAEVTWPSNHVGAPIQEGIELLLYYAEKGNGVIIHTARPQSHESRIWKWLEELGLQNAVFNVVCGKPLGGIYIDDRAFRPDYVDSADRAEPEPVVKDTRKEKKVEAPSAVVDEDEGNWEPDAEGTGHPADWNDPDAWTPVG